VTPRGRPNFVFGAEKRIFFYFSAEKDAHFRCILFFGINMAVKIVENSECFNSADARRAS